MGGLRARPTRLIRPETALRVGIGACAAVSFASLFRDAPVLMGPDGLQPAADIYQALAARGRTGVLPGLFAAWPATDGWLRAWAAAGVVGSLVACVPAAAPWLGIPLAFLYASFVNAGTTFYSFQWDSLLCECLLLTTFLGRSPGRAARLVAWTLWARLSVESGLAKLLWSDDWTGGVAMGRYWETAPLPTPGAWWADRAPEGFDRLTTWGTLVGELFLPVVLLAGRRARLVGFAVWSALQAGILATANYGIFNWLSAVLGVALLWEVPARWPRLEATGAAVLVPLGLWVGLATFARLDLPIADTVRRWHVSSAYHLFARVDPERDEVELMGTDDGTSWRRLPLVAKPPEPMAWWAPYHPRVSFRLWFFTLNRNNELGMSVAADRWVGRLARLWCVDPERLAPLLSGPTTAPERVALYFWRATFHPDSPVWVEEPLGRHPVVYDCDDPEPPRWPQVDALEGWRPP
jgi:hypothetical protein